MKPNKIGINLNFYLDQQIPDVKIEFSIYVDRKYIFL